MKPKRRKWLIGFLWLLVLAAAALIFYFSTQDGETSGQTSNGLAAFVLRLFIPGYDGMTRLEKAKIISQISYYVRKAAHFTEFAMLGASLRLLLHALRTRCPLLITWVSGTLYACTDELHQMFVDGRGPMWRDVCIDSAGVLTAALLVTLWLQWRRKRRMKKG